MTRDQVLQVLPAIVNDFTSEATQQRLSEAQGDLGQVMNVIFEVQGKAIVAAGVDPMQGLQALGQLEQTYADDAEVQGLLAQLKQQVEQAKQG